MSQIAEPLVAPQPSDGLHEVVELDVCGHDVRLVRGARAARACRQPGVTEALVNYATGRATVELEPSAVDAERLVAAVQSAGYNASPVAPSATEQARTFEALERSEAREQARSCGGSPLRCRWPRRSRCSRTA